MKRSIPRPALLAGIVLVLIGIALVFAAFREPVLAARIWWFLAIAALMPCLGSHFLHLIHAMTGGGWFGIVFPVTIKLARAAPWVFLALLPLAIFPQTFAYWAWQDPPPIAGRREGFVAPAFFYGRSVFYLLVLGFMAFAVTKDYWGSPAAPIMILYVLALFFFSVDWVMVREPLWHSSGFPFTFMALSTLSAMALAVSLRPASPGKPGSEHQRRGANLLFAIMVLTSYLATIEFVVTWMGDLPAERGFYLSRDGVIDVVCLLGAVAGMVISFVGLLMPTNKGDAGRVRGFARLVMVAAFLFFYWILSPHGGFADGWLPALACALAGLSLLVLTLSVLPATRLEAKS